MPNPESKIQTAIGKYVVPPIKDMQKQEEE
jgi:hypothetical protein